MPNPTDNLMAAHRALLESSQTIGLKSFEAATRLLELQTQAAQGLFGANGGAGGAPAQPGTPDPRQMMRGAAEYTQRATQLMLETQTEMMRLLQTQASQLQALVSELVSSGMQNAAAMRPAMESAASAMTRSVANGAAAAMPAAADGGAGRRAAPRAADGA
ncbi:Phasin (PHA-granule associated protein) [Ramlibacter tataouinensis]|uniref:Phasin (PHA granule-associated protein)-like protein n=1 Tax=Ramlibacter tataouinensis (strain ATCC BAA-407 / DSM 14655 / LMG 21543 / TTB310) TaxID=365046 RepID=F5XW45_RAMTT|nr:Phasin (PHA-granule associated protein) [Ramlibacter tataouinensis]AEG94148.1 phasin (PHA granule-associated protein)-like protein [Ramlibacter tataouinensis TTB310]